MKGEVRRTKSNSFAGSVNDAMISVTSSEDIQGTLLMYDVDLGVLDQLGMLLLAE